MSAPEPVEPIEVQTARRQRQVKFWLWIVVPLFVPVALVCLMVFASARDIHRKLTFLSHTPKLELTWMQPSLTHGFWIEYRVQPDLRSGDEPITAVWYLRPWRQVLVGKWFTPP